MLSKNISLLINLDLENETQHPNDSFINMIISNLLNNVSSNVNISEISQEIVHNLRSILKISKEYNLYQKKYIFNEYLRKQINQLYQDRSIRDILTILHELKYSHLENLKTLSKEDEKNLDSILFELIEKLKDILNFPA